MSSEYDRKFDEMKKYIPFLESMIKRLESTSGTSSNPRLAQLDKIRSLRDLLLDKKKRMKMDNLLKCEQVLINLYAKVEQRDKDPRIKNKSNAVFDVESLSPREKNNLDEVRNKLKVVTKLQDQDTLPEIARASQIEESTVGKEPALFQRRPNKSPIRHPTHDYIEDNTKYSKLSSKRNYTRVLVSPESSPSRRQFSPDSTNKLLYKRRSPRKSSRDMSSHYKRERNRPTRREGTFRKIRDLNITLNVPEESLASLNTEDILSRIINCSDNDVDIDTLRELRSQILGELKDTGANNDISDLILKSYKKNQEQPSAKKDTEIEEGELSDSESEAIESIYGSLVVVDKDAKSANELKKQEKIEKPRKIQICLVINSDKQDSDGIQLKDTTVDISDFDSFEGDPKSSSGVAKDEVNKNETNENDISTPSDFDKNKHTSSDLVQIDITEEDTHTSQSDQNTDSKKSPETERNIPKDDSENEKVNVENDKRLLSNEKISVENSSNLENMSKNDDNTVPFKANFYKPLNDEECTKNNSGNVSKSQENSDMVCKQSTEDNDVALNTVSESRTTESKNILDSEKNVDIPLLNEPSVPKKPEEKTIVSEIDILQALKNEILSESIAIPGQENTTPPLHQPKLTKVASAKEIMPKKRISIEKYKEKSVSTTVKNLFRKSNEITTEKSDVVIKTKIKLTEKECERFNLPSRLSLDDQISSDDEAGYNSDILIEDVYGDLAPKSPDVTNVKEMDISPPVIIPADPVKETLVASKADVDMRTLPPIISPNPSIDSNSSSTVQEHYKGAKNDSANIQTDNISGDTKKLLLDPRIRKELLKKDSPNPNLNPERTPRPVAFSTRSVTPMMTPNSRSYEMTPTHRSFEVDIPSNRKHVYAPFASTFDVFDTREHSVPKDVVWDRSNSQDENSVKWELNKIENRDRDSNNKYVRDSYQTNRRDEPNYRRGGRIERYKIDRREEFRPDFLSKPGPGFVWTDNSNTFRRLEAASTPVVGFGRSDCARTPTHSFGRSDCPATPSHPFGRSETIDRNDYSMDRINKSNCPATPSHPFGRSECPSTPSHAFGRSECPRTPSHPFGRLECPPTPSHPLGRSEFPVTPSHPFGRSDCPSTPSHPFSRSDCPSTPNHSFGRADCPPTPTHPFGRWKGRDYEEDREYRKYGDRNYDIKYQSQSRNYDLDSWSYRRENRNDYDESNDYTDRGLNYNRDIHPDYRGTGERTRDYDQISGNYKDRRAGYNINSRSSDDLWSTHQTREKSIGRYIREDPRSRQRATSVQNNILSVHSDAGRSFKIDTSVNTTFQNFIVSKGLSMITQNSDARRSRATSVGRSLQRESSIGPVNTTKPAFHAVTSELNKNERYRRASSLGRDLATNKSDRSFKDIKADFKAFKERINLDVKKPVEGTHKKDDHKHISETQQVKRRTSRWESNELTKNTKQMYSPAKNIRDPRMRREYKSSEKKGNNYTTSTESYEKKNRGIIYSNDNIAKGTVLGSGSGVKNYKIPKLKSVIEEKEREERIKREKEEQEKKEREEKVRRENELKEKAEREKKEKEEKEKKEKEEKEKKEKEEIMRLEKEESERKQREEKENLERERKEKERLEKEIREKIEKERLEKERLERIEKERLKREKLENVQKENVRKRKEQERLEQERKEKEEQERKEIEKICKDNISSDSSQCESELIGLSNSSERDSKLDFGVNIDSPTKRITRSHARLANLDSSDEIKPKRYSKANVIESDSDIEEDLSFKNSIRSNAKTRLSSEPNPVNNNKVGENQTDEFHTTFEVDELFGDNIASDPVIDNINALIADLDNDIDTTKTDSTETFKNEISLEHMMENITSSQENDFKDTSKSLLNNSASENTNNLQSLQINEKINGNNMVNIGNVLQVEQNIKDKSNTEQVVTTSATSEPDRETTEKAKTNDVLDDRSNDGCSTPDSTIVNDPVSEKPKEISPIKDYCNESNSDVTSTLDTVESSVKDNVQSSSSYKDISSLSTIGNLLSILQDKSKIKELLTMMSDSDNDKIKKKLEKLSELVSDDEDSNDMSENKVNSDEQIECDTINSDCNKQDDSGSKKDLDTNENNSSSCSVNKQFSDISLKEVISTHCPNEIHKDVAPNEDNNMIEQNNYESKLSQGEDKCEYIENNTCSLNKADNIMEKTQKKVKPKKKNKLNKNMKGKFLKKSVSKQKDVEKKQNCKPRRNHRNELQKLQQDIKQMFEHEDILNSSGIRMCRIAKLVNKKDVEQKESNVFQDPRPVVVLNKSLDSENKIDATPLTKIRKKPGPKTKHKSLVDSLKDIKVQNITHKPPGLKSKTKSLHQEESDPYAFESDSISESNKAKESGAESDFSDSENCSLASSSKSFSSSEVLLDIKKKRRRRGTWQTGVIRPKHKKKPVETKPVDHTDNLILPKRDISIPDLNCFVDKMYCFQKNLDTYSCRLCVYTGTDIIIHYKKKHPHIEIPLSRFDPKSAEEAIAQSESINFQEFTKVPSKSYTCRFCYKEFVKSQAVLEKFFWHIVSTHTGEYKQQCSECSDIDQCPFNLDIPPPPKNVEGQLIGYICEKCNFTQISLENLKTHVIVRHNDEQTVVYTINLSAMTKKMLNSFIKRCNATNSRALRSTRSINNRTSEMSDAPSDKVESENETQIIPKKQLFSSPVKRDSPIAVKQIQSKITFETEDNCESNDITIKTEKDQLNISNEITNDITDTDTVTTDNIENERRGNDGSVSSDINAIAHFKVSYKETGGMEYVCCINGFNHFRTIKLISLKLHARKHTEDWDGYCIICKVIVTPQGVHNFHDCLQHFINIHMGEFPVMERAITSEVVQVAPAAPAPVEESTLQKPYINVRPLSDLISNPAEELLPEQPAPSPVIESVVSLTQTIQQSRASPSYPSTSIVKTPEKAMKYEEWQASVMSKKHRVVLSTMMTKGNLIKVFKCAGRFCSFTSDNAEEALMHASTHQMIGGEGAMNCAYCDFDTLNNAIDLVMHVFKSHGRCQYACALCFYRAAASQLVGAHIASVHPNFTAEGNVLRTTTVTAAVPEDTNVLPRDKAVRNYVCAQKNTGGNQACPTVCTFKTYTPGKFGEHLTNKHKPPYTCAECKETIPTATDLVMHMKSHGFRLYQCTWCVHGADKETDLISHVASTHPDKQPQAYIRIITNKDGTTEYRVLPLAYLNKSKVPTEDVTPSKSDDPIREADRSLELEKLIGQTAILMNTTVPFAENVQAPEPMISEQPTDIPLESVDEPSALESVFTPSVVSTASLQSSAPTAQSTSTSSFTNIKTPLLSTITSSAPSQTLPVVQGVSVNSTVSPVIKTEPIDSSAKSDVVLGSDDDNPSGDVIYVSDDEPESVKSNDVAKNVLLMCPGCKAVYISIPAFIKHVLQNGHGVGAIKCPHMPCKKPMDTLKDLIEHYHRDHASEQVKMQDRFNCSLCGAHCKTLNEIKQHFKEVHNVTRMRVSLPSEGENVYLVSEVKNSADTRQSDTNKTVSELEKLIQSKQSAQPELATITPLSTVPCTVTSSVTTVMSPLEQAKRDLLVQMTPKVEPVESNVEQVEAEVAQIEPEVAQVILSDSDDDPKLDVIDLSDDDESTEKSVDRRIDRIWMCPVCLSSFSCFSNLTRHMTSAKHNKFPLKCPHTPCSTTVDEVAQLQMHYMLEHTGLSKQGRLICGSCCSRWNTLEQVKEHMSSAHGMTQVKTKANKKNEFLVCGVPNSKKVASKNTKVTVKQVYNPDEICLLPIKPILDKSVHCSLCTFNTKVRLNMVRHLEQHLKNQQVPKTAPVNPVPHLATNEKHFDKMLNLASSSIMTRPEKQTRPENPTVAVLLPPEAAAKYPKYVPERQRLTCGAKGCSYISVDEAMLKCHWETLHSGTSDYHCVHCPPYQHLDTSRELTASRVITHLKMHDVTLYACSSCVYYHYMKSIVEKHIAELHNGGDVLIVREEAPSAAPAPVSAAPTMDLKPWQCGLCKFKTMLHPKVVDHCSKVHSSKMQFKCGYCPFRTSTMENVIKHQANSHTGKAENVFYYYYREGAILDEPDGTPRWMRQRQMMPEHVKPEMPDAPSTSAQPAVLAASSEITVDLNKVKKEVEERNDVELCDTAALCSRYGQFCEPNGLRYKCSLCKVVCVDAKEDMESHLYEELKCRKWGCGMCPYKAFHLAGLTEHTAAEHRSKRQEAIQLPVDANLERWVQAYLEHQSEIIKNNRKSLDELKQAAAKAVEAPPAAVADKQPDRAQCQYTQEDLVKAFGVLGAASDGKYCCPKCDFVTTEYDVIKGHLEGELGKIRWTCSTCNEHFLTYHQAQYHCKSAHPTVPSRPNPAARQHDMRAAWIKAVIDAQAQAMSTPDETEKPDHSDNSLLVVRYEESVSDQDQFQQKRKRPTSDSEDDNLIIDEPQPKRSKNKMAKCKYCTYIATNAYNLHYHMLRHFNLYPLSCNYCKFTGTKSVITAHLTTEHPSLPASFKKTTLPDEQPPAIVKMGKKRPQVDTVICLYCEQRVPGDETVSHVHDNVIVEFSSPGQYVIKCSACHMLCLKLSSLIEHHNISHKGTPMNYLMHELSATKEVLRCSVCDKVFEVRKDLYLHQRNDHSEASASNAGPPNPKRVARKSTSKLPTQNAVARKSTTKLPYSMQSEEYSFYGTKPDAEKYEHVTTLMPFCNMIMSFTVKKLKDIININPAVAVEDFNKKGKNV